MYKFLEATHSSYFLAFQDLIREIQYSLEEAQDITSYLKSLVVHLDLIEKMEFANINSTFSPLFHIICLIWSHCKYYCKISRIVVLLKEINNLIIKRVTEFLEPKELFKLEPEEVICKLDTSMVVLNAYQNSFHDYKAKIKEYFKNGLPIREWLFSDNVAFLRYDKFKNKLQLIKVNFELKNVFYFS